VSDVLTETILLTKPSQEVCVERRPAWRRRLKILILFLVVLWVSGLAISFAIQHTVLKRRITARLESAFGRPVEVGTYALDLWGRPTLEARNIVVGEDPRFGHEYFLRAESLTINLRWLGLLRGRVEFGAISLSHPSLNLVRNPDGDWNLAEWLPHSYSIPGGAQTKDSPLTPAALRFTRIEVNSGRVNFKRGDEKLPFAFTEVTGYVQPEGAGQWRLDLEAVPYRAAAVLQQAGTLHLSGHVGGTSSRLRPAALDVNWSDASIPDVLRLARASDFGVRGNLAVALKVNTEAQDWNFDGRVEIRQLHRWDLPSRVDNPSLNLIAKGTLDPELASIEVFDSALETPRSHARASGSISWNEPSRSSDASRGSLRIVSAGLDMNDALAWARAFHAGIADDLVLRGLAKVDFSLDGWPPRIEKGTLSIDGADLTGKTLPVPVSLALPSLRYDSNGVSVLPSTISFGAAGGALHIETFNTPLSRGKHDSGVTPAVRVFGNLSDAADLISTARLLGWDISRGWDLSGPVRGDLKWQGAPYPWRVAPSGSLDFGLPSAAANGEPGAKPAGDLFRAPFLNLPVEQIRAHVDVRGNARHIAISSAEAFGAHWNGTLDRHEPDRVPANLSRLDDSNDLPPDRPNLWQFSLSADHLSATDIDRWLNPRWRESFLDRILPFLGSRPLASARPELLAAKGSLGVDQFTLAPFSVHRLQADVALEGRRLLLTRFRAQLAKGEIAGSLRADLTSNASYRINVDYSGIDLYALTAGMPSLADRFAGSATGNISVNARGTSRADLISSLQCRGESLITAAELMNIDLAGSFAASSFRAGHSSFRGASADFTCAAGKIQFQRLRFSGPAGGWTGVGQIDFSHGLDLKFSALSDVADSRAARPLDSRAAAYRITGDLAEPEIARLKAAPARP
jgi:hypothetical protein